MGICCAQKNFEADKNPLNEVFGEVIQKSNRSSHENPKQAQEITNIINEQEIYIENSKLLLSTNPKINVMWLK